MINNPAIVDLPRRQTDNLAFQFVPLIGEEAIWGMGSASHSSRGGLVKFIRCQGKSFITTDDVANAVTNFSEAARKRGRVVIIDVPVVVDGDGPVVQLVLFPGEPLEISESAMPHQDLDTSPLIRSLTDRRLAWLPHKSEG